MTTDTMVRATTTARGFALYEFTDRYGKPCSLQRSSIATESCIWLGVDDERGARMHLTPEMVKALLPILQHFADTEYLPSEESEDGAA
jgi:hypothetical protein